LEDKIETICNGTLIQHGKTNDRIYLIKLKKEDCPQVLNALGGISRENNYSKILCKVPGWAAPFFFSDGYLTEAYIPKFYQYNEPVFFLAKYLNSDRLMGVEYAKLVELGNILADNNKEKKQLVMNQLKLHQVI